MGKGFLNKDFYPEIKVYECLHKVVKGGCFLFSLRNKENKSQSKIDSNKLSPITGCDCSCDIMC